MGHLAKAEMKAELLFSEDLVNQIAERVIEQLRPLLSGNDPQDKDALMTIEEASAFLKTTKEQIYQWVNNAQHGLGTFPYLKAGKLLRFSKTELLKWLQSR